MKANNKIEVLKKLSTDGTLQGGFATLSETQLLKMKGGSGMGGSVGNNCRCSSGLRGHPTINNYNC